MRVRNTGFLRGGRTKGRVISASRRQNGGTAAQAAVVIDHTEAARETKPRVRHLGAERLPRDLADDLDQATEMAMRIPALRLAGAIEIRPVMGPAS